MFQKCVMDAVGVSTARCVETGTNRHKWTLGGGNWILQFPLLSSLLFFFNSWCQTEPKKFAMVYFQPKKNKGNVTQTYFKESPACFDNQGCGQMGCRVLQMINTWEKVVHSLPSRKSLVVSLCNLWHSLDGSSADIYVQGSMIGGCLTNAAEVAKNHGCV